MDNPVDEWVGAELRAARAEAGRLLADAREVHHEAEQTRARARKLAARFVRRFEHRHAAARRELDRGAAELAADVARLNAVRGEFHAAAADARDRLRDAWAGVEAVRKRAADEWAEADRYFTEQTAALDARAAAVAEREHAAGARLAQAEAETAGLREEAAALERRVQNARAALAELEARRDRARAELLRTSLPTLAAAPPPDDRPQRELLLDREKAAVAALRSTLERDAADLADGRRLVAEQLGQLADARVRWHLAERQTVAEMEELALALRRREHDLDARQQHLIRADVRRREDAHDLWRVRLRLEAWQARLTALDARWRAECGEREADLGHRAAALARREAAAAATFARWEQARAADHARLRTELERWAADRARMQYAAAEFDRRGAELLAESAGHAARVLAAEQLVAEALQDGGSGRAARRFRVLRRWWQRVFDRRAREIETRRAELAAESLAIEGRYRELYDRVSIAPGVGEGDRREAEDPAALAVTAVARAGRDSASAEVEALRAEVERLAAAVLEMDPPEPPEAELPWAVEPPAAAEAQAA